MPTYRSLMDDGVTGQNGLLPAFPPNTGVGWYSLMTGTWPSEHGSTNNTYHRVGDVDFNNRTSFSAAGSLQADTLAAAAERAGKKVAQIDWVGGVQSGIVGPTVDFVNFFSTRGVLAAPLDEDEQAGAAAFGVSYQVASFEPASGWSERSGRGSGRAAARDGAHGRDDLRGAEPHSGVRHLPLRLRRQRHRRVRPRAARAQRSRQERRTRGGRPRRRGLQGDQAEGSRRPDRHARRTDRRLLHEAHHALAGPLLVQALLHLGGAGDRNLRDGSLRCAAGRPAGREQAREVHRRQPADVHLRRTSPRSRPGSSTRRPTSSRGGTSRRRSATPFSTSSWGPSSRTPTSPSSAIR